MTHEFQERKEAAYPDADPEDAEALRFVKSWHRYPPLHEALWYRGVNLGEVDEYLLLPEIITALLERDERRQR
ncbi:MAG: hypothetical protein JXR94_03220 [Candidatus Hydrogenedentes bacterium]|nr:hypothetical protein [Candidatus Hydrogenedentota bacterium]